MAVTFSYEADGHILIATVDNPPVNALSHAVRAGLLEAAEKAAAESDVMALIITAAGRTFMAGADITEFGRPPQSPSLPEVIDAIEGLEKPVVAAIFGTTLGGGLEVALGCHYRVAQAGSKFGLPEVHLGILPGAGGTQRLPRLAGIPFALDAIVSGRHISVQQGQRAGVIDHIVTGDLMQEALNFTAQKAIPVGVRRSSEKPVPNAGSADQVIAKYSKSIARKSRGFFAPEQCIACVAAAAKLDFEAGMAEERARFKACMENPQSKALQHIFFAERQCRNIPDIQMPMEARDIKTVGIIGAGTMGGGIAMSFANVGIPAVILDMTETAVVQGMKVIQDNYQKSVQGNRLTAEAMENRLSLIKPTTSYSDLAEVDLVIEAVTEDMDVKKKVFERLDKTVRNGAILATNTSYLDVDDIAAVTNRPEDVVGLHFFSPANVMKLVEIVRAKQTGKDVLVTALALSKTLGKIGVVAGVCHGFIGNRMVRVYGQQAYKMASCGTPPQEIDKALYQFGMAMGPFAMGDMAGLDIGYMNRKAMPEGSYDESAFAWVDRLVEMGRKGQKTGAGIYRYSGGSRTPAPDPETSRIIGEEAQKRQLAAYRFADDAIVERCMLALINEGADILSEGIALRASDINIVYVNGYGFPSYRGGPMYYADHLGLKTVVEKIKALEKEDPKTWKLSSLLAFLAEQDSSFAAYDAAQKKAAQKSS